MPTCMKKSTWIGSIGDMQERAAADMQWVLDVIKMFDRRGEMVPTGDTPWALEMLQTAEMITRVVYRGDRLPVDSDTKPLRYCKRHKYPKRPTSPPQMPAPTPR